jgi:hypothetical protein
MLIKSFITKVKLIFKQFKIIWAKPKGLSLDTLLTYKLGRFVFAGSFQLEKDIICKVAHNSLAHLVINESKKLANITQLLNSDALIKYLPTEQEIICRRGYTFYIESKIPGYSSQVISPMMLEQAIKFSMALSQKTKVSDSHYTTNLLAQVSNILKTELHYSTYDLFQNILPTSPVNSCVQHGDYWSNNILFSQGSNILTGVIDWEESDVFFLGYDLIHLFIMNENNKRALESGEIIIELLNSSSENFTSIYKRILTITDNKTLTKQHFITLYWLVFVENSHRQLPLSKRSPRWIEKNVVSVLNVFKKPK